MLPGIQPIVASPSAPVGYTIKYGGAGFGGQKGYQRRTWRIGLFGCFKAWDCGANCCCAHCCCGSRIWYQSLRAAGMDEETIRGVAIQQDQAAALRSLNKDGQNPFAEAMAVGPGVAGSWTGALLREELGKLLFGKNNMVSPTQDWLAHTCCLACGRCQEVDAVMTYSYEAHGQRIYYGNWNSCECGGLRGNEYQVVREIPYQGRYSDPPESADRPLLPGRMER